MAAFRPRPAHAARLLAGALLLAGCGRGAPTSADGELPAAAARDNLPYVSGVVTVREDAADGVLRVRVHARSGAAKATRLEALVTVHPDSLIQWRDGRPASTSDLRLGRLVTVWVQGPELRSAPPQVTGSVVLLERSAN